MNVFKRLSVAAARSPERPAVIEAVEGRQFLSASLGGVAAAAVTTAPAVSVSVASKGRGVKFVAYEDVKFHGVVGSFAGDLTTSSLSYNVSIAWGDGKTTGGQLHGRADGRVDVIGDHKYAENGTYGVRVRVSARPVGLPGQPVPLYIIEMADFRSTADVRDLKPVTYHRSHWLTALEVDINVTSTGVLQLSGPLIRTRPVQLTEGQEDALRAAFAAWGTLKSRYPNPPGTADANDVTIGYGGKTVTVGDAATAPAAFDVVRNLLERDAGLR